MFKNCIPFTDCTSEINNTEIDNDEDIDVVMSMYSFIEYSDTYSKISVSLWQYYTDDNTALTDADAISNFHVANNSASIKFKQKITDKTADGGTKNVEIMVSLKYLSNFWRILKCL